MSEMTKQFDEIFTAACGGTLINFDGLPTTSISVKAFKTELGYAEARAQYYLDMRDLLPDEWHRSSTPEAQEKALDRFRDLVKMIPDLIEVAEWGINAAPTGNTRNEMTDRVIKARSLMEEPNEPVSEA